MQLIAIWLLSLCSLLLDNRISCNDSRLYCVQLIQTIDEAAVDHIDVSAVFIDETFGSFDYGKLSIQDRTNMCGEAVDVINKKTEETNFNIADYITPDYATNFILDMNSDKRLVRAFPCPTRPSLALLVYEQNAVQIISIIVRYGDLRSSKSPTSVDGLHFSVKLVSRVIPIRFHARFKDLRLKESIGSYDTGKLPRRLSHEMCTRALTEVEFLAKRGVKLLERTNVGERQSYILLEENLFTGVQAFPCPTAPPIYLEVLDIADISGSRTYWIWVIVEGVQLAPKFDEDLNYQYQLVAVQSINSTIVNEATRMNLQELPEQQRYRMCVEAFQEICRTEKRRKFEFLDTIRPGKSEFYSVQVKPRKPRNNVVAFSCPTHPLVYLSVDDRESRKRIVWVILPETELKFSLSNIVDYELKVVDNISELNSETPPTSPAIPLQDSSVDLDSLSEDECRQLCNKAMQMTPNKMNIKLAGEIEFGPSKFYLLKWQTESVIVQALKCPTNPALYLHVKFVEQRGNIVWICMQRRGLPSRALNIVGYRTQFVQEIIEVSLDEIRSSPSSRLKRCSVGTNQLEEEDLLRLCRNATTQIMSMAKIIFYENVETGPLMYYALDKETDGGSSSRSPVMRIFVQAFRCPTKPAILLYIADQEEGDVAWIIVEESKIFPAIEFITFDVRMVENIVEASSSETRVVISNSPGKRPEFDTDTLTENYRRQLCEKAVEQLTEKEVEIVRNERTGSSAYYSILESSMRPTKPEIVMAFRCNTEPPLYLELVESDYQAYSVSIFVKKSDLKDRLTRVYFIEKYVDNIKVATPRESSEAGSIESNAVNSDIFSEKARLQLCRDVLKQESLRNKNIDFLENVQTGPNTFYSLGVYESKRWDEYRVVQAFECPTEPRVFLQLHYWENQGYVAFIILKKGEINASRKSEEQKGWRKPEELRESRVSSGSGNEFRESRGSVGLENQLSESKGSFGSENQLRESIESLRLENQLKESRESFELENKLRESRASFGSENQFRESRGSFGSGRSRQRVSDIQIGTPDNFKIKYAQFIGEASGREITLIPLSRREESFVDTDAHYTEIQRFQMCQHATQLIPKQNTRMVEKGFTGKSKIFVLYEGFLSEMDSEFKLFRGFECPSEPVIYLEVRHRMSKGITATVVVKEDNPFGTCMIFQLEIVNTIRPAESANSSSHQRRSSQSRESAANIDDEFFSVAKRIQMCKQGFKLIKEWQVIKFLRNASVDKLRQYVTESESHKSKKWPAFKCPTEPAIYLSTEWHGTGEYTAWVIMERPTEEVVWDYRLKHVADIARASPQEILIVHERAPDVLNPDHMFSPDELDQMCIVPIEKFPQEEIKLSGRGRRDISRTYRLIAELGKPSKFIKAFACPTEPKTYIQVEEKEVEDHFTIWVIIKREQVLSDSDQSTYELLIVENIELVVIRRVSIHDMSDQSLDPIYTPAERKSICQKSLLLIPGHEFIGWIEEREPTDSRKYVVTLKGQSKNSPGEQVSAFECPTNPPVYIHSSFHRVLKKIIVRVIIKKSDLLVVTY